MPFSNPVLIFASVMALILIAPLLARRIRLPEIVGLIFAGLLVGPHGIGLLARDQTIDLLGTVGLLFIMFMAGLEIDLNQVRRNKSHTIIFGLLTFTVPLVLGTALGMSVLGMGALAAVLLASMFSSHTLVTFPVIGKLGLTKYKAVTTTIGGTIITDILALLILAVIANASHSVIDAHFWINMLTLIAIYVGGMVLFVPILARWFFRKANADENMEFVFVIALTFMSAYLGYMAGLEPIIGAFLAGLTFNALIPENSLLMSRIRFTGSAIFVPFFLLSVGMLVDFRLLLTGSRAWIVSIGMVTVALAAKYLAATISAKLLGYNRDDRHLIFGLSVNQAAATLAAVLVGYNIGLFSETIITGTIIMIAITCFVGSVATERAGRKVAIREAQAQLDRPLALQRIMIPLASREGARELIDIALLMHDKGSQEPLYPLRVVQDDRDSDAQVAQAEKILAHTVIRTIAAGVPVMPITCVDVNVAAGIVRSVKDNRISMVLFGWTGQEHTLTRTFGRTIDTVIERSRHMIMVNRAIDPVNTARRMVVIIPPFAEREVGFNDVVHTVKVLAHQAGTSLLFLCTAETILVVQSFVGSAAPKVPTSFVPYPSWKGITETIQDAVMPDDWLLLMSVRKGEIAWQPTLDRLPKRITRTFPDIPFTVIVAPTEAWDAPQVNAATSGTLSAFLPGRILLRMQPRDTREALQLLLACFFGQNRHKELTDIATELHLMSQREPVELISDVVLLHTYIQGIDESIAFLGISDTELDIPLASGAPHILIILLDPIGQDPAKHLQALGTIAKLIRIPGIIPVLRQARSVGQLSDDIAGNPLE